MVGPCAAALTGIRSALAVGITSAFWFATAWPNGPTAVVVAAVVCSLLASLEQPDKISMAAAATVLIAAVPVFATQFYLMPLAVDFPSMAVALAPLMLTCGFIMAQPRIGPLGLLSAVYFAFASNIDNVMTYDAVAFLNSSLAVLVGIAVAVVLFATFFPETPAFAVRRFRRQLVVHLGDLAGLPVARPRFDATSAPCSNSSGATLARVKDEPKAARECLTSAMTACLPRKHRPAEKSLDCSGVAPLQSPAKAPACSPGYRRRFAIHPLWKLSRRAAEARALGSPCPRNSPGSAQAGRNRSTERDHCRIRNAWLRSHARAHDLAGKVECNPNLISWARLCRRSRPGSCSRWRYSLQSTRC